MTFDFNIAQLNCDLRSISNASLETLQMLHSFKQGNLAKADKMYGNPDYNGLQQEIQKARIKYRNDLRVLDLLIEIKKEENQ